MPEPSKLALPAPVGAATASETRVWCSAGDRLFAYEPSGSLVGEAPAPAGLVSLATAGDVLAATVEPGIVVWLDAETGAETARRPLGGDLGLAAGGGAVWTLDVRSQRAWRLAVAGALTEPLSVAGVDRFVADGERIWWTSRDDTLLHGGEHPVELGVASGERGGMVACAGSVWISAADSLVRVGAWGLERGPLLAAPEGPVAHLTCAAGVLVGGSGVRGLFVLDPTIDAGVRHLAVDLGGRLAFLVATRVFAWAIPEGKAEARLVRIRPAG